MMSPAGVECGWQLSHAVHELVNGFEILLMSLERATVDGLGILTHGSGLVGKVATLRGT